MSDPIIEEILFKARKLNEDEFRDHDITSGNTLNDVLKELDFYLQKHLTNKKRTEEIIKHISDFSAGDFSATLSISAVQDELDVISMGLNVFVEELRGNAISIKAFDDVFDSFKSPFFIVNTQDKILTKFNKSTLDFFNYIAPNKYHIPMAEILDKDLIEIIESLYWVKNKTTTIQRTLNTKTRKWIVNFSKLDSTYNPKSSIAVFINDVTEEFNKQRETENLIFRTIVDTQEKERIRFAKDIHDSLGQQLSGISFHLLSLNGVVSPKRSTEILTKSSEALKGVMEDIRNICFNLMPKTLENEGLAKGVYELCRKIELSGTLGFHVIVSRNFPRLDKSLEIGIFRIVQEFINNAIKHGQAKKIDIILKKNRKEISLSLKDNGIGFDFKKINANFGMGLKNVRSRVKSFNGEVEITSVINKGTNYDITIPIIPHLQEEEQTINLNENQ
jgi:signal transduction histidine kinase